MGPFSCSTMHNDLLSKLILLQGDRKLGKKCLSSGILTIFKNQYFFSSIRWKNDPALPNTAYEPTKIEHVANIITHGVSFNANASNLDCIPAIRKL